MTLPLILIPIGSRHGRERIILKSLKNFLVCWKVHITFLWRLTTSDSHLFDIIEPKHPCAGGLTIDDVQRRMTQYVCLGKERVSLIILYIQSANRSTILEANHGTSS